MINGIDRAFQLRREEPILHILHFRRAHNEASAMDVYDGGQWIIGRDRAVGQHADWFCAKCALDMDLVGGDIGQVRLRHGAGQFQRIGAALRQRLSGQRRQLLSERIAQFGIDKLDCAHEWRPSVCDQAKR